TGQIHGNLIIDTGAGVDTAELGAAFEGDTDELTVFGNVIATLGSGDDFFSARHVFVRGGRGGGNLIVNAGTNNEQVDLFDSQIDGRRNANPPIRVIDVKLRPIDTDQPA